MVASGVTKIINSLIILVCEPRDSPFLYKVDMSKRFCSFGVGFNDAFYDALFREGSDKDWTR